MRGPAHLRKSSPAGRRLSWRVAMVHPLAIGCTLPVVGPMGDSAALGDLGAAAEALGFDSVWVSDHVVLPARIDSTYPYSPDGTFHSGPTTPYLESLTTL